MVKAYSADKNEKGLLEIFPAVLKDTRTGFSVYGQCF